MHDALKLLKDVVDTETTSPDFTCRLVTVQQKTFVYFVSILSRVYNRRERRVSHSAYML